jgi:hypothetical protein
MAVNNLSISGLLAFKFVVRGLILIGFLAVFKNAQKIALKSTESRSKALFVLSTNNTTLFKLSEDDQVYISSRIPSSKYKYLELWLFNTQNKKFYQFIPSTSESTFLHLLKIQRPRKVVLNEVALLNSTIGVPKNHIEVYDMEGKKWLKSDVNQLNFDILKLIDYENELVSPYLVHYFLILMAVLLAFDLGIKYRILKL